MYVRRPTRVLAVLLTNENWDEAMAWAGASPVGAGQRPDVPGRLPGNANPRSDYWFIPAPRHPAGVIVPRIGLYLVRMGDPLAPVGDDVEFRLLAPDDFEAM